MMIKSKGRYPKEIEATELQKRILEQITKERQIAHSLVLRAKIIINGLGGKGNQAIATELGCGREAVRRWRNRWATEQKSLKQLETTVPEKEYRELIEGMLSDQERSGRPPHFTAEQLCQIMAVAVQPPEEYGIPVTHWTPKELANVVVKEGIVESISVRHIGRFLKSV